MDFPPFEVVRVDPGLWCSSNRNVPMMHVLFRFDDAPDAEVHSLPKKMSCANRLSLNPSVVRTCRVHKRVVLFGFGACLNKKQGAERAEQGSKKAKQAKQGGRKTAEVLRPDLPVEVLTDCETYSRAAVRWKILPFSRSAIV